MIKPRTLALILSCTFFLIVVLIVQEVFDNVLFNFSIQITSFFQNSITHGRIWILYAALIVSYLVYTAYLILMIASLFSARKHVYFYVLSVVLLGLGFFSLLKNIFQNPRPFMVSTKITSLDCQDEYGFPSGHSFMSALFFYLIDYVLLRKKRTLMFFRTKLREEAPDDIWRGTMFTGLEKSMNQASRPESLNLTGNTPMEVPGPKNSPLAMYGYYGMATLVTLIVMMSRIICGAHTFMQVIAGSLFGILYSLLIEAYFNPFFCKALNQNFTFPKNWIIFWEVCLYVFLNIANCFFLWLTRHWNQNHKEEVFKWLQQINKCDPLIDKIFGEHTVYNVNREETLNYKCFVDFSYFSFGFATLLLFHILENKEYIEVRKKNHPFKWHSKSGILRYLIHALCLVPLFLMPIPTGIFWLTYTFRSLIAIFAVICQLVFLPYLLKKFGLDLEGDMMRIPPKKIRENLRLDTYFK
jgi:membrane-associated phospholipid phosphatase